MYFINYKKTLVRVHHHKLVQILQRLDIGQKDIHCIERLYWKQTVEVKISNEVTEAQKIIS